MTDVENLLTKARRSIANARRSVAAGDHDFAASRAYFAMFYAASALLLSVGQVFSRHAGVISEFNRRFVHTGLLESRHFEALRNASDQRTIADYDARLLVSEEAAQRVIAEAEVFLEAADTWLRGQQAKG